MKNIFWPYRDMIHVVANQDIAKYRHADYRSINDLLFYKYCWMAIDLQLQGLEYRRLVSDLLLCYKLGLLNDNFD